MKKNYIFKKTLEEFGISDFLDIPELNNVLINSGEVLKNDLFIAIRGGNNYINEAAGKDAYVIFDDETKITDYPKAFLVNDSIKFLQKFAENWRKTLNLKIIGITGSNGKTTTTMLTYHILKSAGLNVGLAGNVGKSFALQVAENDFDYYVIELSSFQLDNMYSFKADVAILLNITPDHLDRYNYSFQNYIDAKMRIVQNQTEQDIFIYWDDDPNIAKELTKRNIISKKYPFSMKKNTHSKAFTENNELKINTEDTDMSINLDILSIKGTHNVYNSMAAALSASVMNIKKEDIRHSLSDFEGVEHRLEAVAKVRNILFINDSKATNVNSCWYALESMKTPVVLILGGTDKGNDYNEIKHLVEEKVHTLIFLGVDNKKLQDFFSNMGKKIISTESMEDAVKSAYLSANKGDTVLLSPCCASFDLFKNYEDRGTKFKECVKNL